VKLTPVHFCSANSLPLKERVWVMGSKHGYLLFYFLSLSPLPAGEGTLPISAFAVQNELMSTDFQSAQCVAAIGSGV
jgi:hypothetical protein